MFGVSRKEFYEVLGRLDALRHDLEDMATNLRATRESHYAALCRLSKQYGDLADGIEKSGLMHYEDGESGWRKGPAKKAK